VKAATVERLDHRRWRDHEIVEVCKCPAVDEESLAPHDVLPKPPRHRPTRFVLEPQNIPHTEREKSQ
jgi:hypothetical protein